MTVVRFRSAPARERSSERESGRGVPRPELFGRTRAARPEVVEVRATIKKVRCHVRHRRRLFTAVVAQVEDERVRGEEAEARRQQPVSRHDSGECVQ